MKNVIALQSPTQPDFIILKIRQSPKTDGTVKAYVDIQVHDVIIYGLKIIENKKGGHFVGWPANKGANKWFPVVECKEPSQSHIAKSVLEEARRQGAIS